MCLRFLRSARLQYTKTPQDGVNVVALTLSLTVSPLELEYYMGTLDCHK